MDSEWKISLEWMLEEKQAMITGLLAILARHGNILVTKITIHNVYCYNID